MISHYEARETAQRIHPTFKAHGRTWTHQQAVLRIVELQEQNDRIGPSDGRVTELNNLADALREYDKLVNDTAQRAVNEDIIADCERDLRRLGTSDAPCEAVIHYTDAKGHRRISRYKTEQGYNRACIRILRSGGSIIWSGI
jgi:hypothetical protein